MILKNQINSVLKKGFTLAEVLITLVIIGIIAAITIPAVINTYVETSTVSKVKKGLSVLKQAKLLAEAQNGPVLDWNFDSGFSAATNSAFFSYLKPHIQLAKDCGTAPDCYHNGNLYYLSGGYIGSFYNTNTSYYKFVLADGSVMWFRTGGYNGTGRCSTADGGVENVCALFWYDTNGEKAPNTLGRDIFVFEMSPEGVFPDMRNDCNKNSNGWGCASVIIKTSDMKYLH